MENNFLCTCNPELWKRRAPRPRTSFQDLELSSVLRLSNNCRCFSTALSTAVSTASRPPTRRRAITSGSLSKRASSNSRLALALRMSLQRIPFSFVQRKKREALKISLYRASASRLVLVRRCRTTLSSSSSFDVFGESRCRSRSSSTVSGPL